VILGSAAGALIGLSRVLVSELLRAKRLEFFSAGLTEVTQNIDGIAVDHLL
jgi:hypothetical protein